MEKRAVFPGDPTQWKSTYSPGFQVSGGRLLFISGQVAFDDQGNVVGKADIVTQARKVFENLGKVLKAAGGDFSHVIKMNYYITDVTLFPKVAAMRTEYFGKDYPASTMVEVKGLVNKDLLLEAEAVAVLP